MLVWEMCKPSMSFNLCSWEVPLPISVLWFWMQFQLCITLTLPTTSSLNLSTHSPLLLRRSMLNQRRYKLVIFFIYYRVSEEWVWCVWVAWLKSCIGIILVRWIWHQLRIILKEGNSVVFDALMLYIWKTGKVLRYDMTGLMFWLYHCIVFR